MLHVCGCVHPCMHPGACTQVIVCLSPRPSIQTVESRASCAVFNMQTPMHVKAHGCPPTAASLLCAVLSWPLGCAAHCPTKVPPRIANACAECAAGAVLTTPTTPGEGMRLLQRSSRRGAHLLLRTLQWMAPCVAHGLALRLALLLCWEKEGTPSRQPWSCRQRWHTSAPPCRMRCRESLADAARKHTCAPNCWSMCGISFSHFRFAGRTE